MTDEERELLLEFSEWVNSSDNPGTIRLGPADQADLIDGFAKWRNERLWGVYKNTDMTEGRGMTYLARLFRTQPAALAWVQKQPDYEGHPMHQIKPLRFPWGDLDSPEGMAMP